MTFEFDLYIKYHMGLITRDYLLRWWQPVSRSRMRPRQKTC